MAWDLWSSSYYQVASGSTYFSGSGWLSDFYLGYDRDLLYEDAINEKCCIQVLRRLISKADTEIDELETELVSLQSELVWAEHEEWSEICCSTLTEKIVWLGISTTSLRSKDENNRGVQLLMHREPADSIYEIVKALLRQYLPEKDEQGRGGLILNNFGPQGVLRGE